MSKTDPNLFVTETDPNATTADPIIVPRSGHQPSTAKGPNHGQNHGPNQGPKHGPKNDPNRSGH